MAREHLTAKEAFHLLEDLCKALHIRIVFGFPKYLGKVYGGALYYDVGKKKARIYIPKSYQDRFSSKNNAVLLHEIGHYMVIKSGSTMIHGKNKMTYLLSIYEECMAWMAAIRLAQLFHIRIDKNFKRVIQVGLDSYIDAAYVELDKHIVKFLVEVQNTLIGNNKNG